MWFDPHLSTLSLSLNIYQQLQTSYCVERGGGREGREGVREGVREGEGRERERERVRRRKEEGEEEKEWEIEMVATS